MPRKAPPLPPDPLTRDELEAEIDRCGGLISALAVRHRGENRDVPFDDVRAAVLLGFVRAAVYFDRRRGVKFTSYAGRWAQHFVQKAVHAHVSRGMAKMSRAAARVVRVPNVVSLSDPPPSGDGALADQIPGRPPPSADDPPPDFWDRVRAALPPAQYAVVAAYYRDGLTLAEIARRSGRSRQRCSQLCRAAIGRLRETSLAGVR